MSHFSGHFEGASTFLTPKLSLAAARDNLRGQKSLGPLKMSLEMAHKVIVPPKKIMSRSFLNSGTLIVIIDSAHRVRFCAIALQLSLPDVKTNQIISSIVAKLHKGPHY